MSRQSTRWNSWDWELKHKERIARKYEKRETLRALVEMHETAKDPDFEYLRELKARLRSVEAQLACMSL